MINNFNVTGKLYDIVVYTLYLGVCMFLILFCFSKEHAVEVLRLIIPTAKMFANTRIKYFTCYVLGIVCGNPRRIMSKAVCRLRNFILQYF